MSHNPCNIPLLLRVGCPVSPLQAVRRIIRRLFKTLEELNNNREVLKNANNPGGVADIQTGCLSSYGLFCRTHPFIPFYPESPEIMGIFSGVLTAHTGAVDDVIPVRPLEEV